MTNDEIALKVDQFPNGQLLRKAVIEALEAKDEKSLQLEKTVEELKKSAQNWDNLVGDNDALSKITNQTLQIAELQKTVAVMRGHLNVIREHCENWHKGKPLKNSGFIHSVANEALSLSPSQLNEDLGKVRDNLAYYLKPCCGDEHKDLAYLKEALALLEKWSPK